jgi:hypothetical protein
MAKSLNDSYSSVMGEVSPGGAIPSRIQQSNTSGGGNTSRVGGSTPVSYVTSPGPQTGGARGIQQSTMESVYGRMSGERAARDKYYSDMLSGKNAEELRWLAYHGQQTGDMELAMRAGKKASDLHIDTEYNKLPDHAKSGQGKLGGLTYAEKTLEMKAYRDAQAIAGGKAYRDSSGNVVRK